MRENVLRGTHLVGERIAELGQEATRVKGRVADALEDSLTSTRRAVKRGYSAAEDFAGEAAHRVKRYPLRSVACSFALGIVAGWLLSRAGKG
jgi:ElaB/YqjD/DUF883 family membrane-anchored ribosome-binding protein